MNEPLVIETDLADAEVVLIAEGMRDYDRDPATFTAWDTAKKELGITNY
jgi:hypothetical protein